LHRLRSIGSQSSSARCIDRLWGTAFCFSSVGRRGMTTSNEDISHFRRRAVSERSVRAGRCCRHGQSRRRRHHRHRWRARATLRHRRARDGSDVLGLWTRVAMRPDRRGMAERVPAGTASRLRRPRLIDTTGCWRCATSAARTSTIGSARVGHSTTASTRPTTCSGSGSHARVLVYGAASSCRPGSGVASAGERRRAASALTSRSICTTTPA
jgi:hypothetical protein